MWREGTLNAKDKPWQMTDGQCGERVLSMPRTSHGKWLTGNVEDDGHLLQQTVQGMLKETELEVIGEEERTEFSNQLELI